MGIMKPSAYEKIKDAYEVQGLLVGKVSYIGKLYLIVKIFDYPCIMKKNEIEIFPINDYSVYLNKDIVVKVTNINVLDEVNVYIYVSHKTVEEEILELNNISSFESVKRNYNYKGIVKSVRDIGVFVTLGQVDGLVPKSRLPLEYIDNSENFVRIGSVVDVNVIFINEEKQQLALSIPSIDPTLKDKEKSPFDKFKESLIVNDTILSGRVVYLEKDCATLHVEHDGNVFTVYIKREDLAWERIQHSADAVFLGEELSIKYLYFENGRLYFDLKWQQQDIYPKELFSYDTENLLSSMRITNNKFIGKISLLKNKRNANNEEISGALLSNIIALDDQDKNIPFVDKYTGTNITAFVPTKYAYGLEHGKYYQFTLNAASQKKREEEHRPYMFSAILENAIDVPDPFKEQVEKSFKENKTPKSNREAASYLKEIGADMYTDRDRMFYELLQNADDASSERGVKVMVQVMKDYLIFTHDGLSFSRQDFRSIVSTANSTKRLDRKKTGYKGIGFKSVFTDSEKVYIKTGGFFFVFDKESKLFDNFRDFYKFVNPLYTEEQLDIFFKENSEYEEEFEKVDHLPWQLLPFWVDECPDSLRGTTFMRNCNVAIALKLDSNVDKYREIIKGIIQKPRFMLFLRNTQRIQFEDKKWEILSIAKHLNVQNNVVRLKNSFANTEEEVSYIVKEGSEIFVNNDSFKSDGIPMIKECTEVAGREKWKLYHIVDDVKIPITSIPERIIASDTSSLSFAFMLNENNQVIPIPDKTPSLYAFLPMEDRRYLFPFFINADFELSSNRQEAKRVSVWNEFIFYNIGKYIVSWVAKVASQGHPYYLSLLPKELFVEELEENKKDKLAAQFNRGYTESLLSTPFILNDKEEIVCQSDVIVDETGFANIIGANDFCELFGLTKRLVNSSINIEPLINTAIFTEIEHLQYSSVVESVLDKKNRIKVLRYWLSISKELRSSLLVHIANIPGNRKNLDEQLCDIPAFASMGKLYSYNKLLVSRNVLLRTDSINGIEPILIKLGFKITDEHINSHPFREKLTEQINTYSIHLYDVVTSNTKTDASKLTPQEKALLFIHFASYKMGIKNEELTQWEIFSNQNGKTMPISELTHMDSSLYNGITKQYVIDENEYLAVGKILDRYLMKEKDQFDKIVVENWDSLIKVVDNDTTKADSLYVLASTTYKVAIHEQAEDKNGSPLSEKKCVFANNGMHEIQDVILNFTISRNTSISSLVEYLTGKLVPTEATIASVINAPFNCKQQKLEALDNLKDEVISADEINSLLKYCVENEDTIFKHYCISTVENGYVLTKLTKGQYVAYTNNKDLIAFIKKNCQNIVLLQEEFSTYKNIKELCIEDNLLLNVLDLIKDVKPHADVLLPIYKNSVSAIKSAYLGCLASIEVNENSFTEDSDINLQTFFMASTIEKQEKSLFDSLRDKVYVTFEGNSQVLSSIKLQHTVEVDETKFPLSKLLPNEDKVAVLVDNLKERLNEKNLPQTFIDGLFGDEIDKGRDAEVFAILNQSSVVLDNGVQLAFILRYANTQKPVKTVLSKVYDNSIVNQSRPIIRQWFINGQTFVNSDFVLNARYADLSKYLTIPYRNDNGQCSIKQELDDYSYVKSNLSKDGMFSMLDYILLRYEGGNNPTSSDLSCINDRLGMENVEYVISPKYKLTSEELPSIVDEWRISNNEEKKNAFLKTVFGVHTEESDIVNVRKYLSDGVQLSVVSNSSVLSQMTCKWIEDKSLVLDNKQYSTIIDIITDKSYSCEINTDLLSKYENAEHRHMTFGEYYLYLYDGEMPWNVKMTDSGYVFHTYNERDIILDGFNIFVNKSEVHNLYDLVRSIVNVDGFSTDDFLAFLDKYNSTLTGTLDGENDEDIDEEARFAASQLAKEEAIQWLSAKGYNTNNVKTKYSFIEGVCKGNITYNIVVKSFRSTSRELKINPNEWLHLLKPNSRLLLYMGHMAFAVVDRKSLLGNFDFLRLRISSSNFSVDGNKLEESLERLANDIQYFERTHFVFERVHENILSRANSLDDYGLFKNNSNQEYSAGNEEDIE